MAYPQTDEGRKRNAEYQRKWYLENKDLHMERTAKQRQKRQAPIQRVVCEYLESHPCVGCGETDILVLDFDHVRDQKEFMISEAASRSVSITRLETEIAKCDVLCRNCHQRRHCQENNWYRAKYLAGTL